MSAHGKFRRTGLTQTTPPEVEPVSLAEAKTHMRIDGTDDDTYINSLITMAREVVENYQNRQLIDATWTATYTRFPESDDTAFILPYPPLSSITSIEYVDTDGDTQTWESSNYDVFIGDLRGEVRPGFDKSYPNTREHQEAVTIVFVAGYGEAATRVPMSARQSMLLLISQFYEHREPVVIGASPMTVPMNVQFLMDQERIVEAHGSP